MCEKQYRKNRKWFYRAGTLMVSIFLLAGLFLAPGLTKVIRAVDVDKACSLTVIPGEFEDNDVDKANVIIELYKIADVEPDPEYDTYFFKVTDAFKDVTDTEYLNHMKDLNSEQYQLVANAAAKAIFEDGSNIAPEYTCNPKEKKTDIDSGLYLMIARGSNLSAEKYVKNGTKEDPDAIYTIANSTYYEYLYLPQLVSLPNTAEYITKDSEIKTSDGEWKYDITAVLKGEREKRLGSLKIIKDLKTMESRQSTTFVFSVDAVLDGENVYSNMVSISFTPEDGASEKSVLIAEKIPVGAAVTVREVYKGANYKVTSDEKMETEIRSLDEETASVRFKNNYSDTDKGTGSITNQFNYKEEFDEEGNPDGSSWDPQAVDADGRSIDIKKGNKE